MRRITLCTLFILIFLVFNIGFQRVRADQEKVEVTFYAKADTYVNQQYPGQSYGSSELKVRSLQSNNARTLIFFDISKIPIGATVLRARLFLYVSNPPASERIYSCYRLTSSWNEESANWNNRPQSDSTYAPSTKVSAPGWVSWDVTNQLQKFLNGIEDYAWTNFGWEILDASEDSPEPFETAFCSKEFEEQDKRPFLTVEFIPPKLEIVMGSSTFISGSWISLTIKRVSQDGILITVGDRIVKKDWISLGSTIIKLSTSSNTGRFSLSEGGAIINSVTIPNGETQVVVYYSDSGTGSFILSVEEEEYPQGYYSGDSERVSVIMDDYPPQILVVSRDPESPTMGDVVKVYANVSDVGSGIKEVNLYYSIDGGTNWVKVSMSSQAGGYVAYIPGQGIFTELTYYIEASDHIGNVTKTPVEKLTVGIPLLMYITMTLLILGVLIALFLVLKGRRGKAK